MTDLPHFTWPFQLGETVEQDTFDDLAASAAVALCTPRGSRDASPDFGVTDQTFSPVPLNVETVQAELSSSDARLDDIELDDLTTLVDATSARLTLDLAGQ